MRVHVCPRVRPRMQHSLAGDASSLSFSTSAFKQDLASKVKCCTTSLTCGRKHNPTPDHMPCCYTCNLQSQPPMSYNVTSTDLNLSHTSNAWRTLGSANPQPPSYLHGHPRPWLPWSSLILTATFEASGFHGLSHVPSETLPQSSAAVRVMYSRMNHVDTHCLVSDLRCLDCNGRRVRCVVAALESDSNPGVQVDAA